MGISIQAGSIGVWSGELASTAPYGKNHDVTVGAGTDRILVVTIACGGGGGMPASLTVTFNGVALTKLAETGGDPNSSNAIFYTINPSVGTYTLATNVGSWYGQTLAVAFAVFTGVDQSTSFGTPNLIANAYAASPATATLTADSDDATLCAAALQGPPTDFLAQSGQIEFGVIANLDSKSIRSSYKLGTSAAVGYSWTSGVDQFSMISVVMNAAAPLPELSGQAILSGITADGGFTSVASSLSGQAILSGITADGGMGLAPGVLTTPVLKNNTGTILASVSGIVANVYNSTTGALVVRKTGLTSNASGMVTISDVLLAAGTTYAYELDLSASSQGRRLPTGVAA